MGKLKIKCGAYLMLAAMLISERADIFLIYIFSACLHELGHFFAAERLSLRVRETVIDFSGVRICVDVGLMSYKDEIILAAAGPLASLITLGVSLAALSVRGIGFEGACELCVRFLNREESMDGALSFLALSSLLQGMSNLLPIRSFDGGRIIYGVSALLLGERAAERIADILSALSAFVLWTASLYLLLRAASGIGIYVFAFTVFLSGMKEKRQNSR